MKRGTSKTRKVLATHGVDTRVGYNTRSRVIYFIGAKNRATGLVDAVKIGLATCPGHDYRVATLQTASPDEFVVFGMLHGVTCGLEAAIHRRFANDHIRGEWFRISSGLRSLIDDLFGFNRDLEL